MVRQDMRLLEVMATSERAREEILALFDEEEFDYAIADHTEEPTQSAIIRLPLPAHSVERINNQLDALDVGTDEYTVVVNPGAIVTSKFAEPAEFKQGAEALGRRRIARDELHSKAADLLPDSVTYLLMTAISAVVATAGVLLDSMSVMVGSMVIAPLLGPSMATSAATVIYDQELFVRSVKYQAIGVGVALASALGFALFVKGVAVPSSAIDIQSVVELSNHTSPTFLLVAVAFCAGIAGAVSLSTSGLTSLVGVMIAAATMPPIGVVGVAIAWARPTAVFGSGAIVLVNVFTINLAAIVSLWYFGYHPEEWTALRETRSRMLKRIILLAAMVVVLAVFLTELDRASLQSFVDLYL